MGIEDNLKIIFLFLNENISCDPSLGETALVGHNMCFKRVIWKIIPELSHLPLLIRSTECIEGRGKGKLSFKCLPKI